MLYEYKHCLMLQAFDVVLLRVLYTPIEGQIRRLYCYSKLLGDPKLAFMYNNYILLYIVPTGAVLLDYNTK